MGARLPRAFPFDDKITHYQKVMVRRPVGPQQTLTVLYDVIVSSPLRGKTD